MKFGRFASSSTSPKTATPETAAPEIPSDPKNEAREAENRDIAAAQRGDLDAFDRLVLRHQDRVYNGCRWVLGDDDEAADAAQEAFVRAWRFLPKFRGDAAFSTWIGHIATNVARDFAAQKKRAPLPFSGLAGDDDPEFEPVSLAISPGEALLKAERQRAVQRALAALPEPSRLVLVLFDLQGHSYEECAAQLQIPLGTVKSRLSRARQALREALGADRELFEG